MRAWGSAVARWAGVLLVSLLVVALSPLERRSFAVQDNAKPGIYEDRAAKERMSRSRYRDLEVASLVIILVAGGAAVLWAARRRKP